MDFRAYADPANPAVDQYRYLINAQARSANVPPCALAAIVEIESGGRNVLQQGMPAGDGCGVGLCQITAGVEWDNPTSPTYNGHALLAPNVNLSVAAHSFLRPAIDAAIALREDPRKAAWMQSVNSQLLFWAFAAYNGGTGFVTRCVAGDENPDEWTTDHYAYRALAAYLRNVERSTPAPAR